jgi:hypothetical protein
MWDKRLAALATSYRTGVLSWVEASGYPVSVRCSPILDEARECVVFPDLPPAAREWRGLACLLFHVHDERLEGLRQMVLKGELVSEDGTLVLKVTAFVTANGRAGTDEMPHAGAPVHMFQFYRLGRSKAKAYLAKRGEPWPPIPYAEIGRKVIDSPD